MQSDDPDFETKAADVIGLYVNPPDHAAVFAVDEKTAIQALDRLDPILPLSPGRAERHGFEYYRHGTLSLARRARHQIRRSARPDRAAPHQRRVCRIPRRHRGQPAERTRDSRDRRQPVDAQDPGGAHVPAGPSERAISTSRRRIPRGSTKSSSGLPRSNAICSRAASSRPWPTSRARFVATSATTTRAAKPVRWSYRNPAHRISSTSVSTVH